MTAAPASSPVTPDVAPTLEPDRYGWRHVQREQPDGSATMERVPLTLEDVLHPEEGDQIPESEPHERRRRYLADVLTARLADDPGAVVLSDVRIAWDTPGVRPHGPDIAVIRGVRARQPWRTFDVAAEGVRPALIIELTSTGTAGVDRSNKLEQYELVGVPQYVIVDAVRGEQLVAPRLLGYHLGPVGYQGQAPDEHGRLWLEVARLWLGVVEGELVCYDEAGRALGDYTAVTAALAAEQAARAGLEARVRELEAELRRRRD
jgi:Uma2 family endonuclease